MRDCPFCGAYPSRLRTVHKQMGRAPYVKAAAYVRCNRCGARGPLVRGEEFDVRNTEPTPSAWRLLDKAAEAAWDGLPSMPQNASELALIFGSPDTKGETE